MVLHSRLKICRSKGVSVRVRGGSPKYAPVIQWIEIHASNVKDGSSSLSWGTKV